MSTRWQFEAIGTRWVIETPDPIEQTRKMQIWEKIDAFDRNWSRFRSDSVVSFLRTRPSMDLGPDAPELLGIYDELYGATAGAVTPLIGGALETLGYDADLSFEVKGEPDRVPNWADCSLEGSVLHVPGPVVLDVGAVGKGFLAQKVADIIDGRCVVDAGGDIVNRTDNPLKVGLEDPRDPESAIGVVEIPHGWALAGSATNRRTWGKGLHHVLDGRTGKPAGHIVAAWAAGPDAGFADGLATAAFFTDVEVLGRYEGWTVTLDENFWSDSYGFPGEIFS